MSATQPGRTFGRYELLGVLGQGGFATVYRARDTALGRDVALKALLPHLSEDAAVRARFMAEGQALAGLRHPNIVTVYDVGEAEGRPFFAMELIGGQPLGDLLTEGRAADPVFALAVLRSLCSAVDYLHAAGIVHRDIKPANVMIEAAGRTVLMDFGIARSLDQTQHTATGASLGTPQYMAPEQVRGEPAGPAVDIYALGTLAYQLFAGRPPFEGDTAYVLHAQAYEAPPPLHLVRPGLPAALYAAINSALAKVPAQRPSSAGQFAHALAGDIILPPPSGTPTVHPPDAGSRRRVYIGAAIGAAAALTAGLIVLAAVMPKSGGNSNTGVRTDTLSAIGTTAATVRVPADTNAVASPPAITATASLPPAALVSPSPRAASTPLAPSTPPPTTPPVPTSPSPTSAPPLAVSNFRVENTDGWSQGQGALQGCVSFTNAPAGAGLRLRVTPAADTNSPVADGPLLPLGASAGGPVCIDVPTGKAIAAGNYLALLYDNTWQKHDGYAFTVQSPPTQPPTTPPQTVTSTPRPAATQPATAPVLTGTEQLGLTADDMKCCTITLDRVDGLAGGGVQFTISSVLQRAGWTSDDRPENRSVIYLTDEQDRRFDLVQVTGAAAADDANATRISGGYRFASLPPGIQWVWLHYGTAGDNSRTLVIGVNLGAAAPPGGPRTNVIASQKIGVAQSGANDSLLDGISRVAVVRADNIGGSQVRLLLSFILDPNAATPGWTGDIHLANATDIYIQDDQGRRSALRSVSGPAANDDKTALTISGWYTFAPLAAGVQRISMHYGKATIDVPLGTAAPTR